MFRLQTSIIFYPLKLFFRPDFWTGRGFVSRLDEFQLRYVLQNFPLYFSLITASHENFVAIDWLLNVHFSFPEFGS